MDETLILVGLLLAHELLLTSSHYPNDVAIAIHDRLKQLIKSHGGAEVFR